MNHAFRWAVLLLLSGCATKSTVYPEFKQPPTISVSRETVSTLTETPAEDYLIPDSQVFVAGKGGAGRYFGLLGVAIDKSRNESNVSVNARAFQVTFKDQLSQALARVGEKSKQPISIMELGGDVLLLPSARLVIRDEATADLTFRVTARFKDGSSGSEGRKNYWHPYGVRPVAGDGGWAADNSALFKEGAERAMGKLAEVILEDLAGSYRASTDPAHQRIIRWKALRSEQLVTSVLLKEEPDYFIVMPILRDRPLTGVVLAMPKVLVRVEP